MLAALATAGILMVAATDAAPAPAPAPAPPPAPAPAFPPPSAAAPSAPSAAAPSPPVVTLAEALAAARRNPDLQQATATSAAAMARADQARSGLLPQVSGSAQYQRTTANFTSRPGFVPQSVITAPPRPSFDTFNFFNFGLTIDQLVYDFGRTPDRWHAAEATAEAQQESMRTTLQRVLANVRSTYFSARAAKALVGVAAETLANQRRHLDQIQAFVEVGTRPEIDLAQARTDLANARVQLINAQNQYATAKAQLVRSIGMPSSPDFDVADESMPAVPGEDGPASALLEQAFASRPELASFAYQIRASELSLSAARAGWAPSLGVNASVTDAGTDIGNLAWNVAGGVSVSWPLFQGGLTAAQSHEAAANVTLAQAQLESQRQQVRLETEQARLGIVAAKAALLASDEAVVNARERLRLAEGRYETGVGNIIELGDAQLALTNALGQRVQADYNVAAARVSLLLALGRE